MADETSSIALQLNVQLRGLVNLTKLNTALVELKKNARGFQTDLAKGNSALGNVGKKATEAAKGLTALTKANKDLAAAAKQTSGGTNIGRHMTDQFASFSKAARAQEAAAKQSARVRTQQEQMYARMFDQLERKRVATTASVERQRIALNKATARTIEATERRTAALRDTFNRRRILGLQKVAAQEAHLAKMELSLTGRLRKYEEMNDAIFRAGFRLQMLGNDMEALGRKAIGALTGMANEFGEFEFMVNRAAGATGTLETSVDGGVNVYARFKDSILEASQELRLFKPEEVAKATYFWASTTGQQVNTLGQLESVMRNINPLMKIAAMTQTDYETAIKGVYAILTQYGMSLDRTTEVTEKLHMVTQRTAAEFPDLVNSFKMVGPVAREFGVTFDDMVVLLGRLADAGIRGTMSGRAFRQFFIQISRPAPKATAALDELWKSTQQFGNKSYLDTVFPEGKFIGVNNYVDELAKRLQNATDKERMFTLATITTANELPVLTALVSKQIASLKGLDGGWDKSKENLEAAAEGFRMSWDKLRNSWNGTVGALTRGVEIIRIKVGERIAKIFGPVLEQVTEQLENLREWFSDEANGPIVDFFVKLAAASAVVLTLGGALTVLVGVLVAMTAAFRVAWKAFQPLFGLFGKLGGVVVGLAVAVVRNFDYIKEAISEAAEIIDEALKGNEETVSALGEAFEAFANIVAPVFDVVIRIFGELLKVGAKVIAFLLQTEGAINILAIAANVLGGIIAGRMVIGLGRAVLGFTGFTKALNLAREAMAGMALTMRALDVSYGVGGGGFKGISAAIKNLLPALGRGGLIGAGIAAVAASFLILYANSETLRNGIDRLVFEIVTSMDELVAATEEARAALGEWAPEAQKVIDLDPTVVALKADIERLRAIAAQEEARGWTIFGGANRELKIAEKELQRLTTDGLNTYQDYVDSLNDLGANITLGDFMEQLTFNANKMNKSLTSSDVLSATNRYFTTITNGAKAADKEAARLIGTLDMNLSATQRAINLNKLASMSGSGELSDKVSEQASAAVNAGIASGLDGVEPPPEAVTAKVWNGVANSLIESGKRVFDFGKVMKETLKASMNPREIVKHLREHTREVLQGGFGTVTPEGWALLGGFWQDIQERNQDLVDLMTPAKFEKYATETIKGVMKDFKNGFPTQMPEPIRQTVRDLVIDLYKKMNVPIPQNVIDALGLKGVEAAGAYVEGLEDPKNAKNAETATEGVRDGATAGFKPTDKPKKHGTAHTGNFLKGLKTYQKEISTTATSIGNSTSKVGKYRNSTFQWGSHMSSQFARGLLNNIQSVQNAARRLAGVAAGPLEHTTPKEGPLKDDDMWGFHMGQNIADGMNRSVGTVSMAAMNIARAASLANTYAMDNLAAGGVSVESSANRIIKVQVEVTSPDGSVDRLKAAELERGIMTNDLLLSIEHMATVG